MEQVVLKVKGMVCGHCKSAVENSLKSAAGVRDAVVDLLNETVKVSYEPEKITEKQLAEIIAEAGYRVVK